MLGTPKGERARQGRELQNYLSCTMFTLWAIGSIKALTSPLCNMSL